MIEELFTECDAGCVESIIKFLAGSIGGKPNITVREGVIHASIEEGGVNILDIRLTNEICELILLATQDKVISVLRILGLKELAEFISKLKVLPSIIAISRITISKSLYIILQGRMGSEAFPNIKVVVRENYHEVSSSFCRITPEENTCEHLHNLLEIAKDLWRRIFKP